MPLQNSCKSLNARGLTLVEAAVGVALAALIALVAAGLFRAGIKTYNYGFRQVATLADARKAMFGNGDQHGLVWTAQTAGMASGLYNSSMTVTVAGVPVSFFVTQKGLVQSRLGLQWPQAGSVTSVAMSYYNLDSSGRIMVSTSPASATLLTMRLSVAGKNKTVRNYYFYSGAQLRNHQ